MKRILVPIDFSKVSRSAADLAVDVAERSGAEVIFLHSVHFNYFVDYPYAASINMQPLMEDITRSVEEKMDAFIAEYEVKNCKLSKKIDHLHLLEAVKDTVAEENIGLVILGTEGTSGWSELFIGSNTERIVRWVDCPVMAVPCQTSFESINRILAPVDLREIQDDFMDRLLKLQKLFSATIEFLWVKTPHNIESNGRVIEEFSNLIKDYGFKDATFGISNNVFPSDGILEHARDLNVDLIAMATHARRGISHWLSGSITEDTVNHIDLPVWTFKLDPNAVNKELLSIKEAKGTPEYKKMEMITL